MSANPRGHVQFEALGKTYTMVFSINAICRAEDRLDKGIAEIADRLLTGGRLGYVRTLIWAGLGDKHSDLTEAQVGALIDDVGLAKAGALSREALAVAFPEAFAGASSDSPQPAPGAGGGPTSSSRGSKSGSPRKPSGSRRPA